MNAITTRDFMKSIDTTSTFDMASSVAELQRLMHDMPQWDAGKHTTHHFADQMYCRVLFRPAGTLIVGKAHKKSHFYIVCVGSVLVTDGEGNAKQLEGPCVVSSKPGTKRAVLALTDAVCLTVHITDKTDLEEIERELIEPDETALFDAHNRLKSDLEKLK